MQVDEVKRYKFQADTNFRSQYLAWLKYFLVNMFWLS